MAQEDDLRALGKVMDFMRGISVIFLLTNCYWFCYEAFQEWHFTLGVVNRILMNFQHTAGLFSSILWTKRCMAVRLLVWNNRQLANLYNPMLRKVTTLSMN